MRLPGFMALTLALASTLLLPSRAARADDDCPNGVLVADNSEELQEKLFTPDLIMSHQKELSIDDRQRTAIINEITKAQTDILQGQWQLKGATELLSTLLEATPIDEPKALAQAEKVMNLERDVKKANLAMLIRIKNQLTATQQKKLAKLRDGDDEEEGPFSHEQLRKLEKLGAMRGHHGDDDDEAEPATPAVPAVPARPH